MSQPHEAETGVERGAPSERNETEETQQVFAADVESASTVEWIFFLLGCAVLLPWNATITAMPFFNARLGNSQLRSVFASYLVASMQISRLPTLFHATYSVKMASKTFRIRVSGILLTILVSLLLLSTYITDVDPGVFFGLVIANAVLQSCIGSYFQTSIVAIASWFGPLAIQSMFSGQAAVAVIISGFQLLSAFEALHVRNIKVHDSESSPYADFLGFGGRSSVDRAATSFFLLMTAAMIVSLISHDYLTRMPIYKKAAAEFDRRPPTTLITEQTPLLLEREHDDVPITSKTTQIQRILRIARINWTYNLAIFLIFFVTLAVFPAVTGAILSVHAPYTTIIAHPLIFNAVHYLVFNLGDWVGRWLCRFKPFQVWSGQRLLAFSFLRIAFVPLFLLCNIQPGIWSRPPFYSDVAYLLTLFLFGLTNGQFGSLCMMSAPSLEHNKRLLKEDVDTAAALATFCLAIGLTLGSIANFGVRAIICRCNPFIN